MRKIFTLIIIATLALAVPLTMVSASQDKDKPVHATDVELVKKVTVKGSKGQGKPSGPAATGISVPLGSGKNRYAIIIGISDYPGTGSDLILAMRMTTQLI